jgi:hypothetical protein
VGTAVPYEFILANLKSGRCGSYSALARAKARTDVKKRRERERNELEFRNQLSIVAARMRDIQDLWRDHPSSILIISWDLCRKLTDGLSRSGLLPDDTISRRYRFSECSPRLRDKVNIDFHRPDRRQLLAEEELLTKAISTRSKGTAVIFGLFESLQKVVTSQN